MPTPRLRRLDEIADERFDMVAHNETWEDERACLLRERIKRTSQSHFPDFIAQHQVGLIVQVPELANLKPFVEKKSIYQTKIHYDRL